MPGNFAHSVIRVQRNFRHTQGDSPRRGAYLEVMARIGPKNPIRWYVREWRLRAGLTLQQVADRLETSPGTISDLETGRKRMNSDWMEAFAWAYGIEPAALLRDPEAPTVDELLRAATPEQRRQAIKIVKSLLDEDAA